MGDNIKSYDGDDSYYSGTDEEYEEFLKSVEGKVHPEAKSVEDTQNIDLGETKVVNLQEVISKFRKKASEIKDASVKFTSDAVDRISDIRNAMKNAPESTAAIPSGTVADAKETEVEPAEVKAPAEEKPAINVDEINDKLKDTVKTQMSKFGDFTEGLANIKSRFDETDAEIAEISKAVGEVSEHAAVIRDTTIKNHNALSSQLNEIETGLADIKKGLAGVSKLSDSVFDLKNTQLNTKNTLENLEKSFNSLRNKCVAGITIVAVLSAVTIVLGIIQLLS